MDIWEDDIEIIDGFEQPEPNFIDQAVVNDWQDLVPSGSEQLGIPPIGGIAETDYSIGEKYRTGFLAAQSPEEYDAQVERFRRELTAKQPDAWKFGTSISEMPMTGSALLMGIREGTLTFRSDLMKPFVERWQYNFEIMLGPTNPLFVNDERGIPNQYGVLIEVDDAGNPTYKELIRTAEQGEFINRVTEKTMGEYQQAAWNGYRPREYMGVGVSRDVDGRGRDSSYTDNSGGSEHRLPSELNISGYLSQNDPRWANEPYTSIGKPRQTIASSACGPTSMAMAINILTNKEVTPLDMANFSVSIGTRTAEEGTDHSFFDAAAKKYGLNSQQTWEAGSVQNAFKNSNTLVIASMDTGHFTQGGHFVLIVGKETLNGTEYYKIYDPNDDNDRNYYRNGKDGVIIKTDIPGIVYAQSSVVHKEAYTFFIITKP